MIVWRCPEPLHQERRSSECWSCAAAAEIDLLTEVVAAVHVRLLAGRGPESPSHWKVNDVVLSARAAEAVQRALDNPSTPPGGER